LKLAAFNPSFFDENQDQTNLEEAVIDFPHSILESPHPNFHLFSQKDIKQKLTRPLISF